jgi:Holliday junction resolvase RusA-like endonuclease
VETAGVTEPDVQLALLAEAAPLKVAREPFCVFELEVEPRGWERAGATIRWGQGRPYIHWFVTTDEANYREAVAWAAKAAMRGRLPTERPVALLLHAFMPIAASWSMRERSDARSGAKLPTGTPDWDNIGKSVGDALKGIVWVDDAQVVDGRVIKRHSERPALRVEVRELI